MALSCSLITTVFNEASNIERFLLTYRNQTRHADEFIIVDGGSTDGTGRLISDFADRNPDLNIRLIIDRSCSKTHTPGPIARGRNVAIAAARHEWIAATDAGCELSAGWLEAMLEAAAPGVDIVSGWYEPLEHNRFQSLYAAMLHIDPSHIDPKTFLPSSRSIAFRKRCWEAVGGYPELTYTAEDTLFDLRLRDAGFVFAFAPTAIVRWECPSSLREAVVKQFRYGEGDGYLRLFPGRSALAFAKLLLPVGHLLQIGRPRLACLKYALLWANQLGYLSGMRRSRTGG